MMISTRGRYALRVMTDLAQHSDDGYIPLKSIAQRQNLSQKYLESIMTSLSKAGFVEGAHGKGGGYKLAGSPENCRVGDILRLTEGTLAPVACLADEGPCERADCCPTLPMWTKLDRLINDFFDGITIKDLLCEQDVNRETTD